MSIQVFSRFVTPADCENAPPCVRAFESDIIAALEHVYMLRGPPFRRSQPEPGEERPILDSLR
jgi:hypothetical protein